MRVPLVAFALLALAAFIASRAPAPAAAAAAPLHHRACVHAVD